LAPTVAQNMNFGELVKKHPSIIGLIVAAFILIFIAVTILTKK
jgi:hypothetical protein